jgi:MFS family permease
MKRRQLAALFVCGTIPFIVGNVQVALLAVYLTHLGVDSASIGNYLALIFLSLAVGTICAGWLSDRFQRRKLILVGATLMQIPLAWLMSQTTQVVPLIALLVINWFLGGIGIAMVQILAGLFAPENERGKIFGILGLTSNLGTMIGGEIIGLVLKQSSYSTLFVIGAVITTITPLAGTFLEDKAPVQKQARGSVTVQPAIILGLSFYLLLIASTLVNASSSFINLGRPLLMDKKGFDSEAISSVITVGGAVGIPVPLLIGWLSDRLGRYRLIILSYLVAGVSVALVGVSTNLWHFWIAALLGAGTGAGNAVASALVTDLVPQNGLGRALSWLNATGWLGGVIGFTITGYIVQGFGLTSVFLVGGALPIVAILLLMRMRSFQPAVATG